nr:MAG TPA: DNA directed RNA polymerase subunit [Caudoviricetes sp.]
MKILIIKGKKIELTEDECIKQFEKLACKYANKFINYDFDEMKQISYIAIWKAYKKYDADKGNEFITLATKCIYNDLLSYTSKRSIAAMYSLDKNVLEKQGLYRNYEFYEIIEGEIYYIQQVIDKIFIEEIEKFVKQSRSKNRCRVFELLKQGKTNDEIAAKLGLTHQNATRIRKGIAKSIRKEFGGING